LKDLKVDEGYIFKFTLMNCSRRAYNHLAHNAEEWRLLVNTTNKNSLKYQYFVKI
jgi:hypothetical protein